MSASTSAIMPESDKPGVLPVVSDKGGLLSCPTPIEAAMELLAMHGRQQLVLVAKMQPAAVPCAAFAHVSVEDVLAFICRGSRLAPVIGRQGVPLPTDHGDFIMQAFRDVLTGQEHVALSVGELSDRGPVLTRLHSECLTGDVFASNRCDCGEQLASSLQRIAQAGRGLLIYLRQEGRGIGLGNKLKAYELQDAGLDTADANLHLGLPIDARNFALAAMILNQMDVGAVRLITNNPAKIDVLRRNGIEVVEREIIQTSSCHHNDLYLRTKRDRLGHLLGA